MIDGGGCTLVLFFFSGGVPQGSISRNEKRRRERLLSVGIVTYPVVLIFISNLSPFPLLKCSHFRRAAVRCGLKVRARVRVVQTQQKN